MRSGGIDVASVGWSAYAIAINGKPHKHFIFKPDNPKDTAAQHALEKYVWLKRVIWLTKPDVIAVEESNVFSHKKAIRAIARHEGISLLVAKQSGAMVVNPGVSTVRSITFAGKRIGKKSGSMSKEDAWTLFNKIYFDVNLPAKTSGGMDAMDAYVLAIAAPTILERR
jgi:hypothetical protein